MIKGILMEIDGIVTTGFGKGKDFLNKEFYSKKFMEKLNFKPYPGTLNLIVSSDYLDDINTLKCECETGIKGENNFGSVKYIKAVLNNEIKGAIVFPEKTTHEENYLEFISDENLREKYNLEDNDKINLKITNW